MQDGKYIGRIIKEADKNGSALIYKAKYMIVKNTTKPFNVGLKTLNYITIVSCIMTKKIRSQHQLRLKK